MRRARADDRPVWQPTGRQAVVMSIGLGLVLASLFVPFGQNDAGCYDHCAEAHRYYVWHPFDNLFGPIFLGVGIVAMVATCWGRPRTQPRRWGAALCGWFGVFVTLLASPTVIEETLYGTPSFEPRGGGVLVSVGFGLLFLAAAPVLLGPPLGRERRPDRRDRPAP